MRVHRSLARVGWCLLAVPAAGLFAACGSSFTAGDQGPDGGGGGDDAAEDTVVVVGSDGAARDGGGGTPDAGDDGPGVPDAFASDGAACAPGDLSCNGSCVPQNAQNCGTCGNACTTGVAHAHPTCSKGSCSFECDGTFTSCSGACVDLQGDADNCGACGRSCNGGQCSAGVCQPYVVAMPSNLGRIATDGSNVLYVRTSDASLWEVPAAGGTPIELASGGAFDALVVGSGKAFYGQWGTTSTLGLATVGSANSGATLKTISGQVTGATMNPSATRYLYTLQGTGSGGAYDCAFGGSCMGAGSFTPGQVGVAGGDDNDFFYGNYANIEREALGSGAPTQIESGSGALNELLADGTYVYWAETNATAITTIYRTLESNPGTPTPIASNAGSFATDGTTVYFLSGSSVKSTAATGGTSVSTVATEGGNLGAIAMSGKLLLWTYGNTIYGLVLP